MLVLKNRMKRRGDLFHNAIKNPSSKKNNTFANQTDIEIFNLIDKITKMGIVLENSKSTFHRKLVELFSSEEKEHIFSLLMYSFKQKPRNINDLTLIKYYLSTQNDLIDKLKMTDNINEFDEIITKLSTSIKCEILPRNQIIFINGELGDKFYIIFKGKVGVLIPSSYPSYLTLNDYVDFLRKLYEYKEYDLLVRTINSNLSVYYSDAVRVIERNCDAAKQNFIINGSNHERLTKREYMNRVIPTNKDLSDFPSKVTLWKYYEVCELKDGDSFGEVALFEEGKKRNATIINLTDGDIYLGTINRNVYKGCINEFYERTKKQNVEAILANKLFSGLNSDIFCLNYFNSFRKLVLNRSDYLFKQGDKRDSIYFLKTGEIELTINSKFKHINLVIEALGGKIIDSEFEKISEQNYKMKNYYNIPKIFSFCIIKDRDIIGLDEYVLSEENNSKYFYSFFNKPIPVLNTKKLKLNNLFNKKSDVKNKALGPLNEISIIPGNYYCNARCISQKAEVFKIEIPFFCKILQNVKQIYSTYKSIIPQRKKVLCERIQTAKEMTLSFYYSMVNEKDFDNWRGRKLSYFQKKTVFKNIKQDDISKENTRYKQYSISREKNCRENINANEITLRNTFNSYHSNLLSKFKGKIKFIDLKEKSSIKNNVLLTEYECKKHLKIKSQLISNIDIPKSLSIKNKPRFNRNISDFKLKTLNQRSNDFSYKGDKNNHSNLPKLTLSSSPTSNEQLLPSNHEYTNEDNKKYYKNYMKKNIKKIEKYKIQTIIPNVNTSSLQKLLKARLLLYNKVVNKLLENQKEIDDNNEIKKDNNKNSISNNTSKKCVNDINCLAMDDYFKTIDTCNSQKERNNQYLTYRNMHKNQLIANPSSNELIKKSQRKRNKSNLINSTINSDYKFEFYSNKKSNTLSNIDIKCSNYLTNSTFQNKSNSIKK